MEVLPALDSTILLVDYNNCPRYTLLKTTFILISCRKLLKIFCSGWLLPSPRWYDWLNLSSIDKLEGFHLSSNCFLQISPLNINLLVHATFLITYIISTVVSNIYKRTKIATHKKNVAKLEYSFQLGTSFIMVSTSQKKWKLSDESNNENLLTAFRSTTFRWRSFL